MNVGRQIVGVNDLLGNMAVKNMQGTTRAIYDSLPATNITNFTFFENVQARQYPFSNINNNRFEVGESLAVQQIAIGLSAFNAVDNIGFYGIPNAVKVNLYIGNQRVLKDLALEYAAQGVGQSQGLAGIPRQIIYLETPIIIPPQIEFYVTVEVENADATAGIRCFCLLQGTGTLLNTKENY